VLIVVVHLRSINRWLECYRSVIGEEEGLRILNLLDLIHYLLNIVRYFEVIFVQQIQLCPLSLIELRQSLTQCLLPVQLALQVIQLITQSISHLLIVFELIDDHCQLLVTGVGILHVLYLKLKHQHLSLCVVKLRIVLVY
jgi:hypothetical protein